MEAVLYVGHGSRMKAGAEEAKRFVRQVMKKVSAPIQELCFLELTAPDIMQGIERCIERGATSIAIVPLLLLTAVHAKEDIPNEIAEARHRYPDVRFSYGRTLGVHPDIVEALYDRITAHHPPTSSSISSAIPSSIHSDAKVIIVGRGSSDADVKKDLLHMASMLQQRYAFQSVDVCFLYGAEPSYSDVMTELETAQDKHIYIVPYLLFTGLLLKGIEKRVAAHRLIRSDQLIVLCEALGYHQAIENVLIQRVNEVLCNEVIPHHA